MSFVKKVVFAALMIFSLNAFSQNYEYPVLKQGVKNDIENLIANQNNFVGGTTEGGDSILYLKYNNNSINVFSKYTSTNYIYDYPSANINYSTPLITVSPYDTNYNQCVQFAQTISNAGQATGIWKSDGNFINQSTYLHWKLIAKFKSNGYYDGSSGGHVALAIGSNANGVYVIDQNWEGNSSSNYGKIAIHIIPWETAEEYSLLTKPSN
jgi:hypothetical protein